MKSHSLNESKWFFLEKNGKYEDFLIDGFIDYLHRLTVELHLPGLKEAGVEESSLYEICASTECKNNPVKLDFYDLMEIISRRFI